MNVIYLKKCRRELITDRDINHAVNCAIALGFATGFAFGLMLVYVAKLLEVI